MFPQCCTAHRDAADGIAIAAVTGECQNRIDIVTVSGLKILAGQGKHARPLE